MKNKGYVPLGEFYAVVILLAFACVMPGDSRASEAKKDKVKWVKSKTGLSSLMTLSKDRSEMIAEYKRETRSYNLLKKAMESGLLESGAADEEIIKKYGQPVMAMEDAVGDTVRWVYKPSEADYFKGEKIYLFFDKDGKLNRWETVDPL
jgi:hypothetical protein